jgi:hypothetical protein
MLERTEKRFDLKPAYRRLAKLIARPSPAVDPQCQLWLNDAAPPRADDEGRSTTLPQSKSPTFATNLPGTDICSAAHYSLFDHLVGAEQDRSRYVETQRLRGLEIDD